jgi:ATP-dependent Clp protease protease subunit
MIDRGEILESIVYGIDLKNRKIYFGLNLDTSDQEEYGDFTNASVEMAVRAIHRMAAESATKPIEIHMNSYGGDAYAMLRLHDAILCSPCQIKFFGGGSIMSSATWIMAVCDERYLYPNATVMVHDGSDVIEGKHTDVQIGAVESKRLQGLLYDIYANNSKMPRSFWEDVCQRDLYLTAEEAIALGLADKLVEFKKRGNLRRLRQACMRKNVESDSMKKLVKDIYKRINKLKVPSIELNTAVKEPIDPEVFVEQEKRPAEVNQLAHKDTSEDAIR